MHSRQGDRKKNLLLCPREPDITEAPFFFKFLGIEKRTAMGENSFFKAGDKNDRKRASIALNLFGKATYDDIEAKARRDIGI